MKTKQHTLDCKKCNSGKVKVTISQTNDGINVLIKRCDNKKCNYQYQMDELFKDNNINMLNKP